jgi:polyhydroxybutyrate depolymerase
MKSRRFGGMRLFPAAACLAALVSTQGLHAQETKEKVTVDDVDRTFMVRLPRGYDASRHYPVMILLHGLNQDADDMERLTRFDDLADKDSIIAVYPMALHGRWNLGVKPPERRMMPMGPGRRRGGYPGGGYPGGGYPGGGYPGGGGGYPGGGQQPQNREPEERRSTQADDIAFFNQLLDELGTKFSVDSSRIYAAGLSEGGFMSMRIGCALGDRIAGIATIGAAMPKNMMCLPSRPVPIVMINGTSDPVVPYGGGTEHNLDLPTISVGESAKAWAKIDHCAEKPESTKLPKEKGGTEAKVDTFAGCQQGSAVILYSLKGAGNTWPGGLQYEVEKQVGKTADDFNANETLWSFLVNKKLPEKSSTPQ